MFSFLVMFPNLIYDLDNLIYLLVHLHVFFICSYNHLIYLKRRGTSVYSEWIEPLVLFLRRVGAILTKTIDRTMVFPYFSTICGRVVLVCVVFYSGDCKIVDLTNYQDT